MPGPRCRRARHGQFLWHAATYQRSGTYPVFGTRPGHGGTRLPRVVGGRLRTLLSGVALSLVAAGLAVVLPAGPAHAAWTTPAQERSIGGTGRASLFPWGMAWNPVSEKYVVTDYFNYQVRQYNADWTYDKTLPQPSAATGDPESVLAAVAIDPRNGDIFVGKPKPDTLGPLRRRRQPPAGRRRRSRLRRPDLHCVAHHRRRGLHLRPGQPPLEHRRRPLAPDQARPRWWVAGGGVGPELRRPAARPVLRDRRRGRRQDLPGRLDQPARAGALARRRLAPLDRQRRRARGQRRSLG